MILRTCLMALSLTPALAAQDTNAAALLERARLQETARGDLAAAARTYEQVIRLAPAGELATRAQLGLGLIWMQTGKEEAARAVLRRAASGEGPFAERAKELLAGAPIGSQDRLAQQVVALLDQIRELPGGMDTEIPKVVIESFEILGRDAVPFVIRAIEEEDDLVFIGRAFAILKALGGERAAEYFREVSRSEDVVRRRLAVTSGAAGIDESVVPALKGYVDDPDEQTAVRAIEILRSRISTHEAIRLMDPQFPRRSAAALEVLGRLNHREVLRTAADELLSALERLRNPTLPVALVRGVREIVSTSYWETVGQAKLSLAAWTWPELEGVATIRNATVLFEDVLDPEIVADTARRLAALDFEAVETSRHSLGQFLEACSSGWSVEALPQVTELVRLGYAEPLITWIANVPSHAPFSLVRESVRVTERPSLLLAKLFDEDWTPTPKEVPAMAEWLEEEASSEHEQLKARFAIPALARARSAAAAKVLVELARRQPEHYSDVVAKLALHPSEEVLFAFRELLTLGGEQTNHAYRSLAFGYALHEGDPRMVEPSVKSYELGLASLSGNPALFAGLGLEEEPVARSSSQRTVPTGLSWLTALDSEGKPITRLNEAAVTRMVSSCLEDPKSSAWSDAWAAFEVSRRSSRHAIPLGLLHGVAERIQQCDPGMTRINLTASLLNDERLKADRRHEIVRWTLTSADPDLIRVGLDHLPEGTGAPERFQLLKPLLEWLLTVSEWNGNLNAITNQAAHYLLSSDVDPPAAVERVRELALKAELDVVRATAAAILSWQIPSESFLKLVPALLASEATTVRSNVVHFLQRHLRAHEDPEAVSYLVSALDDPSSSVRELAQTALDELRTYRETVQFWKNVQAGTSLTSESAAQALIQQARDESNSLEVRVAAIRSLGSLGLPETLPILIEWLKSDVPEIEKAASEAIARINE